jgi:hypothetical protein
MFWCLDDDGLGWSDRIFPCTGAARVEPEQSWWRCERGTRVPSRCWSALNAVVGVVQRTRVRLRSASDNNAFIAGGVLLIGCVSNLYLWFEKPYKDCTAIATPCEARHGSC